MEIKHGKNKFYVGKDEQNFLAEMTYVPSGEDLIIIDHTEVSSELRGQNVGKLLVESGIDYARKNNLKVLPLCPFAKALIDKTPEYQDVLKK